MAWSFSTKALLTVGSVTALGVWLRSRERAKARKKRRTVPTGPSTSRDEGCLFKVYESGKTVEDYPPIWNDLDPSLQQDAVSSAVVDLEPSHALVIYDHMKHLVRTQGMDLENAAVRDEAVQRSLRITASGCDWSEGLGPYTYDSPFQKVWAGAGTLGELAASNIAAKEES